MTRQQTPDLNTHHVFFYYWPSATSMEKIQKFSLLFQLTLSCIIFFPFSNELYCFSASVYNVITFSLKRSAVHLQPPNEISTAGQECEPYFETSKVLIDLSMFIPFNLSYTFFNTSQAAEQILSIINLPIRVQNTGLLKFLVNTSASCVRYTWSIYQAIVKFSSIKCLSTSIFGLIMLHWIVYDTSWLTCFHSTGARGFPA